jgi:glutamine amidotransferase
LARSGDLHRFGEMRYDLVEHIGPDLVRHVEGTTDTEWVYALLLSRLADPFGPATAEELADAVQASLQILRDVRERRDLDTQSPVNLVVSDGGSLVATRFCFDYGWYPGDGSFFDGEREFDFTTLWYAACDAFAPGAGGWAARYRAGGVPRAALIASEPLHDEHTDWLEVPEYSMVVVTGTHNGVAVDVRELEL